MTTTRTGVAVVPIDNRDRIPEALDAHGDRQVVVLVVGPTDLAVRFALAVAAILGGDEIEVRPARQPGT